MTPAEHAELQARAERSRALEEEAKAARCLACDPPRDELAACTCIEVSELCAERDAAARTDVPFFRDAAVRLAEENEKLRRENRAEYDERGRMQARINEQDEELHHRQNALDRMTEERDALRAEVETLRKLVNDPTPNERILALTVEVERLRAHLALANEGQAILQARAERAEQALDVAVGCFRAIDAEYADTEQGPSETLDKIAVRALEAIVRIDELKKETK